MNFKDNELVAITILTTGGLAHEDITRRGYSHLLEHVMVETFVLNERPIRTQLFERGIEIAAYTYGFCIQYSLSGTQKAFQDNVNLILRVIEHLQHGPDREFEVEEVQDAVTSIANEIRERRSRGLVGTFPWSMLGSMFNQSTLEPFNGFDCLDNYYTANLVHELSDFARELYNKPPTVTVSRQLDFALPDKRILRWTNETALEENRHCAIRFAHYKCIFPSLADNLVCEVYEIPHPSCFNSSEVAVFNWTTCLALNRISAGEKWTVGMFGPFTGPDFRYVTRSSFEMSPPKRPLFNLIDEYKFRDALNDVASGLQIFANDCITKNEVTARCQRFGIEVEELFCLTTDFWRHSLWESLKGTKLRANLFWSKD